MLEFLCARLHSRGVRTVILTLGKRGAFLSDVNGQRLVPGFKVKTVDSAQRAAAGRET
jgi:sugar/nucleoside kinase (ribokinase family)